MLTVSKIKKYKRFIDSRLRWRKDASYGDPQQDYVSYRECDAMIARMTTKEVVEAYLAYREVAERTDIFFDENKT